MSSVGVFEAKSQLSALLDRAAAGEEITITKHGKPVAKLIRAVPHDRARAAEAFRKLAELRKGVTLGDLDWRKLRDEGRP
jgi:prevent-host-death family protein